MNIPENFNSTQQKALHLFSLGKNIFLTGPAGSGKTHVLKYIHLSNPHTTTLTSTTGISAVLIGGTTIHSHLGIGFGDKSVDDMLEKIMNNKWLHKRWLSLQTLIIDEISMMSPELFDKLEEMARIIKGSDEPFGGIQLVLSGDFLQLPCVKNDKFCFQAKSWEKCIQKSCIVYFKDIIRQSNVEFQTILNKIRVGIVDDDIKTKLNKRIGVIDQMPHSFFPVKLFSKNADIDRVNNLELDKFASKGEEFIEYDMSIDVFADKYEKSDNITKFIKNFQAPKTLLLCKGAQVMLLVNLDIEAGLANGSCGIVIDFIDDIPLVRFNSGQERLIDYHTWDIMENSTKVLKVKQIPLKIAYAISIHKSQGCTLEYVEMDLTDIFEYGQGYVALSRVKTLDGLFLHDIDYSKIKAHPDAIEFYKSIE